MASISASPITELKLRTDFILDRMAFLESVCEAVHKEGTPQANQTLDLLLNNDYPSIIARILVVIASAKQRDQATWTLANLLGSDRRDVRAAANRACLTVREQIFENLTEPETAALQKSTAYLLFNWLTRFNKNEEVDEQVLRLLDSGFLRLAAPANVRSDLLVAVNAALRRTQAGEKAAGEVVKMLAAANKREFAALLDAFSEICSEDSGKPVFAAEDHGAVFDLFEHLLLGEVELTVEQRHLALWALTNFVCEPNAADEFFTRWDLRSEVTELCESENEALRSEAGWVLANAIKLAAWESTLEDIGTDDGLRYAVCAVEAGVTDKIRGLYKAIHETLDHLSELEAQFAPLEEEDYEDEDEFEEEVMTEIADTEEIVPGLTAAQICEMAGVYNLPCEARDAPAPVVAVTEAPLPSALDLIASASNHNGSSTLRGLVYSLKNSGAAWVPVAAGTTFTIEDLTLMGSLGYVLASGYFGINPCLTSTRYF